MLDKKRNTPLQSKRKVCSMMILFEKKVDERIKYIDIINSHIQTDKNLYHIDISKNTVEKIYDSKIQTIVNELYY